MPPAAPAPPRGTGAASRAGGAGRRGRRRPTRRPRRPCGRRRAPPRCARRRRGVPARGARRRRRGPAARRCPGRRAGPDAALARPARAGRRGRPATRRRRRRPGWRGRRGSTAGRRRRGRGRACPPGRPRGRSSWCGRVPPGCRRDAPSPADHLAGHRVDDPDELLARQGVEQLRPVGRGCCSRRSETGWAVKRPAGRSSSRPSTSAAPVPGSSQVAHSSGSSTSGWRSWMRSRPGSAGPVMTREGREPRHRVVGVGDRRGRARTRRGPPSRRWRRRPVR